MSSVSHETLADLSVAEAVALVSAVIAAGGLIWKVNPVMKRLNNMIDDFMGESARPGVQARLGVMERLSAQDRAIQDLRDALDPIAGPGPYDHAEVLRRLDRIDREIERLRRALHVNHPDYKEDDDATSQEGRTHH